MAVAAFRVGKTNTQKSRHIRADGASGRTGASKARHGGIGAPREPRDSDCHRSKKRQSLQSF
jgi:hypothetical protein